MFLRIEFGELIWAGEKVKDPKKIKKEKKEKESRADWKFSIRQRGSVALYRDIERSMATSLIGSGIPAGFWNSTGTVTNIEIAAFQSDIRAMYGRKKKYIYMCVYRYVCNVSRKGRREKGIALYARRLRCKQCATARCKWNFDGV